MAKKAATKNDGPKTAEQVLAELTKSGMKVALEIPDQEYISTGNMAIDVITNGGIPRGRITELSGPQASGKTTTAVSAAATAIQGGGRVIFMDYERTIDKKYFSSLGVDVNDPAHFTYLAPKTLEEGANATRSLVETGEFDMVIYDSVARMITEKERTGEVGSVSVGERAKLMYAFLRQAVDYAADTGCALVFLNHLLEKIDITPMGQQMAARGIKQYYTPGGNALPYNSSLRMQFKKIGNVEREQFNPILNVLETNTKIGYRHEVKVVKNKTGKPELKTEVINIMGEGFSQSRTALEVLKAYEVVKKSGSWYSTKHPDLVEIVGSDSVQGEETFYQMLFATPLGKGTAINLAHQYLNSYYEAAAEESEQEDETNE